MSLDPDETAEMSRPRVGPSSWGPSALRGRFASLARRLRNHCGVVHSTRGAMTPPAPDWGSSDPPSTADAVGLARARACVEAAWAQDCGPVRARGACRPDGLVTRGSAEGGARIRAHRITEWRSTVQWMTGCVAYWMLTRQYKCSSVAIVSHPRVRYRASLSTRTITSDISTTANPNEMGKEPMDS